jgi:hypothetical protein
MMARLFAGSSGFPEILDRSAIGSLERSGPPGGTATRARRAGRIPASVILPTAVTKGELIMTKPVEPRAGSRRAIADSLDFASRARTSPHDQDRAGSGIEEMHATTYMERAVSP